MTSVDPSNPTVELLIWAYQQGAFPMVDPRTGEIEWYSPDPRAIIPLDAFHVPKSLARVVRSRPFEIRSDTAFVDVMRACAAPRLDEDGEDDTWIDERLVTLYAKAHDIGAAHSIEAWFDGRLVGGLYGIHLGGAFFGESMFVRPDLGGTNASKVCLVHLVNWLNDRGCELLDTQFQNPHLTQFGVVEIRRAAYLERLEKALDRRVAWGDFAPLP